MKHLLRVLLIIGYIILHYWLLFHFGFFDRSLGVFVVVGQATLLVIDAWIILEIVLNTWEHYSYEIKEFINKIMNTKLW